MLRHTAADSQHVKELLWVEHHAMHHIPALGMLIGSCDCCAQERRVAMTVPQAALYDAAVQQFRADAASASGPQPDEGHAFTRAC